MGNNNLQARTDGQTVQADDVNQYRNAMIGDLVPRNSSGSAEASMGDLGSSSLPWASLYLSGQIIQDGQVIDTSLLQTESHQILSGQALDSGYPDFLTFVASTTTGRISGINTPLVLIVNNQAVTLEQNLDLTGLSVGPSALHTCTVNDTTLTGQHSTRTLGEAGESLTIGSPGTEITTLNGSVQVFQKGSEYFLALIDTSTNRLFPFRRGVARTIREPLTHADTLTLRQGNYVFLDADGENTYRTTIFPEFRPSDPGSPSTNQWYFNTNTKRWRRYDGTWSNMDAHLLGFVICDDSEAVAAHPNDFDLAWRGDLAGEFILMGPDTLRINLRRASVAGQNFFPVDFGQTIQLSESADREVGVSEAADTTYYVYADNTLRCRFSDTPPRRLDHRLGLYHPRQYWRYLGQAYNNGSSDLTQAIFNGDAPEWRLNHTLIPANNTAPPFFVDSNSFSVARIDCLDRTKKIHLYKPTSTTVNISSTGLGGTLQSENLSGTIGTGGASSATITGVGTSFLTDFIVGDVIWTASGARRISAIGNDLSLTVSDVITLANGTAYRRGGEAMKTHYLLYAVSDGVNAELILTTRNVAGGQSLVDLPPGYKFYRQLPFAVRNDDSSNIIPFYVASGWPGNPRVYFQTDFQRGGSNPTTLVSSGSATSWTDLNSASFIPPIARVGIFSGGTSSTSASANIRTKGDNHNGQSMATNGSAEYVMRTDVVQLIQYLFLGSGSVGIHVKGFEVTEVQ